MSNYAKITVRVRNARGHSTVQFKGTGRNVSLLVADVGDTILNGPIYTTTGSKAFWIDVLDAVVADITAGNAGGT